MAKVRSVRPIYAVSVVVAGLAVAAASVLFAFTGTSGASSRETNAPVSGIIHVYGTDTSLTSTITTAIFTGAFSDHGFGEKGTWHLGNGTITINPAKLQKLLDERFGTFFPASCSFNGAVRAAVPITGGTKAYAGISGVITITATVAQQGSLLKNGKCNEASNAPLAAQTEILTGAGTVKL